MARLCNHAVTLMPGDPHDDGYWLPLFQATKEFIKPFQLLLKVGLGDQILTEITERDLSSCPQDNFNRYYEILWIEAIYNVLVNLIRTGAQESPEEMAALCERIVRQGK